MKDRLWFELVLVGLLFIAALAVRTYRLDEIPPGLFNDEAANGLDAREILDGNHAVFFERNSGREPFFLYFQALVTSVAGSTPFGLRLSAAILGALTVPATYGMVRALYAGQVLYVKMWALYSALLMAFGYWHICLSRLGFRAVALPLFIALTLLFLGRAWTRSQDNQRIPYLDIVLAGVFLGVSQYTYTAARFFPLAVGVAMLLAIVIQWAKREPVWQFVAMAGLLVGAAMITYVPLGRYFLQHPESFFGRAQDVSILAPAYSAPNPALALLHSARDTFLMFWTQADPNLRHNPAQRPVFELVLSIWLVVGVIVALWRSRLFSYLVLLSTMLVLIMPGILTAEGTPHSLRTVGMMPAVYVLPALGMLEAGNRLFVRRKQLMYLLPLPFVLFSAAVSVNSYFHAWQETERIRLAFLPDYVRLSKNISQIGDKQAVWLLPLSMGYFPEDYHFFTMDFFYSGDAGFAEVRTDPASAPEQLRAATEGRRQAYLLRPERMHNYVQAEYLLGDPKDLVSFLLRKYGVFAESRSDDVPDVTYDVYELPEHADYTVINAWIPQSTAFDGKVELVGVDYGGIPVQEHGNGRTVAAGAPIWVALHWKALEHIDVDLKVSVSLHDQAGHVLGEVDDLLVGDMYPVERTWAENETTASYHIVPTPQALPPGEYELRIRLYEDETRRVYPVRDKDGQVVDVDASVGAITVEKSTSADIHPANAVADGRLTPELALLGYDGADQEYRPGDSLGVTLYWQALQPPAQDYTIALTLESAGGDIVASRSSQPADGAYPTHLWGSGEIVRDIHDVLIPAETDAANYSLILSLEDETGIAARRVLGQISVVGMGRQFERPTPSLPVSADFGGLVNLVGINGAAEAKAQAGQAVEFDLVWEVTGDPPGPLVRFVHLLDAEGGLTAQQDTVPCGGMCPATGWVIGEFLADHVTVPLPEDMEAGSYTLYVGWYDPEGFDRLAYVDESGGTGDAFQLFTIEVQ